MKTIRLLYPDYVSGGLDTYYFGAHLLAHILPQNPSQPLVKVEVTPPDGKAKSATDGICGLDEVLAGVADAAAKLKAENPDRVITIGGNCMVSLAPFDYLHGKYKNCGIVWLDAHPDVSSPEDGYPCAHAMVLGSLLGGGSPRLRAAVQNGLFSPRDVLYVGLQPMHDYQEKFLASVGVDYKVQDEAFVSDTELGAFLDRYDHVLVHLDIDVMDERFFHSTYFADPELVGDGASGGRMTMERLAQTLRLITKRANVVGFTIAEYLPFDEHRLHKMFAALDLFTK